MFRFLKDTLRRRIPCITALVLLSVLTVTSGVNAARNPDRPTVMVILSDETLIYQDFVTTIKRTLVNNKLDALLEVLNAKTYENRKPLISKQTRLIISVGVKATSLAADLPVQVPIYATLIPKDTFEIIRKRHNKKISQFSAVFLDQPLSRQFNLIRHALPHVRRIGVLISNTENREDDLDENLIIKTGNNANYSVILENITQKDRLLAALDKLYTRSDVLLVMPEAGTVNRDLASNILLSSYRYQKPVVGYSHAYVKAGALLAVYSTPEQMGQYTARTVIGMEKNNWRLPEPSYSDLFTVSVNRWLTRSLGLNIKPESVLTKAIADNERAIAE